MTYARCVPGFLRGGFFLAFRFVKPVSPNYICAGRGIPVMKKHFYSDLKLGILGGGQLGRMLIQSAIDFNIHIRVLDPDPAAPCQPLAHEFIQGSLTDYETVMAFGKDADLITIEIENVNVEALEALQKMGKIVLPEPKIIGLIQDKRLQKTFFKENGLPTAPFHLVENREEVAALADFLPAVNKLARAGYDGRGVQVIKDASALEKAFDEPGLLESFVDFEKEIAVIAARNSDGEVVTYPVVEMVFHPEHNLVEYLFSPADLSQEHELKAREIAKELVDRLNYVGLIAIEMFLTKEGEVLINELAPRPHNSGHHTIRSCATSQYEQHLRAILNLPLGSAKQLYPAAMINLLGAPGHTGTVCYQGVEDALRVAGVYPAFYGKAVTKPFRKMGHVTILDKDKARLQEKIRFVRDHLLVVSDNSQTD